MSSKRPFFSVAAHVLMVHQSTCTKFQEDLGWPVLALICQAIRRHRIRICEDGVEVDELVWSSVGAVDIGGGICTNCSKLFTTSETVAVDKCESKEMNQHAWLGNPTSRATGTASKFRFESHEKFPLRRVKITSLLVHSRKTVRRCDAVLNIALYLAYR